jgi:hypothetical protein
MAENNETTRPLFLTRDTPIVAGYSIYRDEEYLRSSLDSVCQYVDVVCLIEGRYLDAPELPSDKTEQIISETASRFDPRFYLTGGMPQKFVVYPVDPMPEVEKRDLFFKLVRPGGYLFIIDGDEITVGDVKAGLDFVRTNDPTKIFWVYVEEDGNPGWKPRIIRVEEGLHYGKNHWTILDKKGDLFTDSVWKESPESAQIPQFKIYNFGYKRTGQRQKARIAYKEAMHQKKWIERDPLAIKMNLEQQNR